MASLFGFGQQGSKGSSYQSDEYGQGGGEDYDGPQGQQARGGYGSQREDSYGSSQDERESQGYGNRQHEGDAQGGNNNQPAGGWSTYAPIVNKALSSVASKYGVDVSSIIPGGMGGEGQNQGTGQGMGQSMGQGMGMQGDMDSNTYGRGRADDEELEPTGGRYNQSSSFGGGANSAVGAGGMRGREDYSGY